MRRPPNARLHAWPRSAPVSLAHRRYAAKNTTRRTRPLRPPPPPPAPHTPPTVLQVRVRHQASRLHRGDVGAQGPLRRGRGGVAHRSARERPGHAADHEPDKYHADAADAHPGDQLLARLPGPRQHLRHAALPRVQPWRVLLYHVPLPLRDHVRRLWPRLPARVLRLLAAEQGEGVGGQDAQRHGADVLRRPVRHHAQWPLRHVRRPLLQRGLCLPDELLRRHALDGQQCARRVLQPRMVRERRLLPGRDVPRGH